MGFEPSKKNIKRGKRVWKTPKKGVKKHVKKGVKKLKKLKT